MSTLGEQQTPEQQPEQQLEPQQPGQQPPKKKKVRWQTIVLLIILLICVVVFLFPRIRTWIGEVESEEDSSKFASAFAYTDTYLYRVGNQNEVQLGSLFSGSGLGQIQSANVVVSTSALQDGSDVAVVYTANTANWQQGTLSFTGTGPVRLTISDGDNTYASLSLVLEVVDAQNVTSADLLGGTGVETSDVLLCDLTFNEWSSYTYSGDAVLYGNGFTIQCNAVSTGDVGLIELSGEARMDNVRVIVQEHTKVNAMNSDDNDCFNYAVYARDGKITITNSYIAGGRAAIRSRAEELTIENTCLYGGAYANMLVTVSAAINLTDVTTAQYITADGNGVMGLSILVEDSALDTKLTLSGEINQYNWVSSDMSESFNYAANGSWTNYSSVVTVLCESDAYEEMRYEYEGVTYLNTGVIFSGEATQGIDCSGVTNVRYESTTISGYTGASVVGSELAEDYDPFYDPDTYVPTAQADLLPDVVYAFNESSQYKEKTEDADSYLYYGEDGALHIGVSEGCDVTFDPLDGASISKYGAALETTATGGGTFDVNAKGEYEITYTVTDNLFYDETGSRISDKEVVYTYTLTVYVEIAGLPDAVLSVTPGEAAYVSGGNRVDIDYYLAVPVLEGLTITEEDASGSSVVVFSGGGESVPEGLSFEASGAGVTFNQQNMIVSDGILYLYSDIARDNPGSYSVEVTFTYTGENGNPVTATVTYGLSADSAVIDGDTSCVTPETLITLADGSQVEIQDLTGDELLLVWNPESGELEAAPVAYIVSHDESARSYAVTTLTFDNGSEIEIIGEHVFLEADSATYVALTAENAQDYIGHSFVVLGEGSTAAGEASSTAGEAGLDTALLVEAETEIRLTEAYEVVSYQSLVCFTDGILSASAYLDLLLNIFDMDEDFCYNLTKMQEEIAAYGLYTYEDFEDVISEEAFDLYNAKYLKAAVGKGACTWEDILALIDIYDAVEVAPLGS